MIGEFSSRVGLAGVAVVVDVVLTPPGSCPTCTTGAPSRASAAAEAALADTHCSRRAGRSPSPRGHACSGPGHWHWLCPQGRLSHVSREAATSGRWAGSLGEDTDPKRSHCPAWHSHTPHLHRPPLLRQHTQWHSHPRASGTRPTTQLWLGNAESPGPVWGGLSGHLAMLTPGLEPSIPRAVLTLASPAEALQLHPRWRSTSCHPGVSAFHAV